MKINFKRNKFLGNLLIGIMFIGFGAYDLFENDNIRRSSYVYLIGGIFFFGYYLYHTKSQYLTIENGTIRKNKFYGFGKQIKLNEINQITKKAGYYYLKTEQKQLKINVELIDDNSLVELNKILKELNLSSEKSTICYHRLNLMWVLGFLKVLSFFTVSA